MKSLFSLILTAFFLISAVSVAAEEMSKQGADSGKSYVTGSGEALPMEKERLQIKFKGLVFMQATLKMVSLTMLQFVLWAHYTRSKGFLRNLASWFIPL